MPSLEISNIVKNYGAFRAIDDVSFSVEPGEFIVMVGPSGCGKSTLLRSIAGLEEIGSGRIVLNGRDITKDEPADRGVAMVFQNYALYPHMTVAQNMGFALKMAGRPKAEIDAAVNRAASILRITEHLHKKPMQLSGGQRQRVAIGRAITRSPEVFLFDEPLSNLDAALRAQMRVELGRLHAELGATMIYVTHDQVEAMTMASRIVVLNSGIIEQIGSPLELYNRPANRFVAEFLGAPKINMFEGQVTKAGSGKMTITAEGAKGSLEVDLAPGVEAPEVGDTVTIGVRPESFSEASEWRIPGKIAVIESLGRETLLYVDAGGVRTLGEESDASLFAVHRHSQIEAKIGDVIDLGISGSAVFLFDATGRTIHFPTLATA